MKNIVLIGMPGCGKSTIGVLLAKSLLLDFVDTDLVIQKEYGASLCEIIEEKGRKAFIEIENNTIAKNNFTSSVVATGGSAVYGEKAMESLKKEGTVVYLDLPVEELESRLSNIKTRGVAMKKGTTIADLFLERKPLYERYADIKIACKGFTPEECVDEIVKRISE